MWVLSVTPFTVTPAQLPARSWPASLLRPSPSRAATPSAALGRVGGVGLGSWTSDADADADADPDRDPNRDPRECTQGVPTAEDVHLTLTLALTLALALTRTLALTLTLALT